MVTRSRGFRTCIVARGRPCRFSSANQIDPCLFPCSALIFGVRSVRGQPGLSRPCESRSPYKDRFLRLVTSASPSEPFQRAPLLSDSAAKRTSLDFHPLASLSPIQRRASAEGHHKSLGRLLRLFAAPSPSFARQPKRSKKGQRRFSFRLDLAEGS